MCCVIMGRDPLILYITGHVYILYLSLYLLILYRPCTYLMSTTRDIDIVFEHGHIMLKFDVRVQRIYSWFLFEV